MTFLSLFLTALSVLVFACAALHGFQERVR